jgi:hypothetical protein
MPSRCRWWPCFIALALIAACAEAGPTGRSVAAACALEPADSSRRTIPDDQTESAGVLFGDTLDLQLDIRRAMLFPEGDSGPSVEVVTFGEAGGAPSSPGPLVRTASAGQSSSASATRSPIPFGLSGSRTAVIRSSCRRAAERNPPTGRMRRASACTEVLLAKTR